MHTLSEVNSDLFAAMSDLAPLSDAERAWLSTRVRRQTLAQGAVLQTQGSPATRFWWVAEGLVHKVFIDAHGREHLRGFGPPGHFVGAYVAIISGTPSSLRVECLRPSVLWSIDATDVRQAVERGEGAWERRARIMAEWALVEREAREGRLLSLSAAEHLRWVETHEPALVARLRQRDLAAYIGVTPESLSRLRARSALT